jgi:hypothetical protein
MNFTLQTFLGSVSLLRGHHLDETESTRFSGVRVAHDVALLNITIFLEKTSDLVFRETGMYASNKKIGAWVASVIILLLGARLWRWTASSMLARISLEYCIESDVPAVHAVAITRRSAASSCVVITATVSAR